MRYIRMSIMAFKEGDAVKEQVIIEILVEVKQHLHVKISQLHFFQFVDVQNP